MTAYSLSMTGLNLAQLLESREKPNDIKSINTMVLTNKKGKIKTLELISMSKDNSEKHMIWFLKPAKDKGISFLKIEHDDKDDFMTMWLPGFSRFKRIKSSQKSDSFMGSDLSFEDLTNRIISDYNYKILENNKTEKWYELARMFDSLGYKIYFLGKSNLGFNNLSILPNVTSLINRTTIEETIHLLSTADLVVYNDSGLMHVASSVNAKILAIFGSTSPKYTPPLSKNGYSKIAYHNVDCSPCFKRTCPYGHLKCLKEIGVDEIMAEAGNLL